MILLNCAVCAAPLAHDAPYQCVPCQLRYCSHDCQRHHWLSGHQENCEIIHRGGDAEQYHAEKKYKWAVAVAVEACAADTKGQTCYICLEGIHPETSEGLVRGCACRGAAGFAHVSCLARQAKVLVAEAEERDLDDDAFQARWRRWDTCGLCKQQYHGIVSCALGWACWKTYVGRPEMDWCRQSAMTVLGNGLTDANYNEDALTVQEAELSTLRRLGAPGESILGTQGNLARTYNQLGRHEEALRMRRDVYSGTLRLHGEEHKDALIAAINYASSLVNLERFEEAKSLLRTVLPVARRVLGESNDLTLGMRWRYAEALCWDTAATLDDVREAITTLEDTERTARRVLGGAHPLTSTIEGYLREARAALRARETPPPGST